MKTINQILKELEDAGMNPDEIQQESTRIMKESIGTRLKLQGPPNPQLIAGLNTDHIMALFKWLIDIILAGATETERREAWDSFQEYRDWDITARHYNAYVKTNEETK